MLGRALTLLKSSMGSMPSKNRHLSKLSRSAFFDCDKFIPNKMHPTTTTTSHSATHPPTQKLPGINLATPESDIPIDPTVEKLINNLIITESQ